MAAKKTASARSAAKPAEAEYFTKEIVANCESIFGNSVSRDCVEAALKMEGLEKASITDAKKITQKFLNKEVV